MRRRLPAVVAAAFGAALVLAACGGDDGGGGSSDGYQEPAGEAQETVAINGGNIFFDPEDVTLPAGVNAIELVGEGGLHTLVVDGVDGFKLEVSGDETDTKKLELEPGEYEFYCDITGHQAAGMEGTLVVE